MWDLTNTRLQIQPFSVKLNFITQGTKINIENWEKIENLLIIISWKKKKYQYVELFACLSCSYLFTYGNQKINRIIQMLYSYATVQYKSKNEQNFQPLHIWSEERGFLKQAMERILLNNQVLTSHFWYLCISLESPTYTWQ
jgi:hypothetical protein